MTIIQQHSPMDMSTRSLKSSPQKVDSNDSFESVLEAVVTKEAPAVSKGKEDVNADNQTRVDSEIRIPHGELLKAVEPENIETIQSIAVNLTPEALKKEETKETPTLMIGDLRCKKPSKNDGTDLDVSMLIPLVTPEIKLSKPEVIDDVQALNAQTVSVDQTYRGVQENAVNLNAQKFGNKSDASSLAVSPDFEIPAAVLDVTLMPKTESISSVIERLPNAEMEKVAKLDSMDTLSDEIPIISMDISSKIPEVKLENNASTMGESAEDLNDPTALELEPASVAEFDVDVKTVQTTTTNEALVKSDNIKELGTVPAQQVHQAIVAGKEGILPTESKTLSIVLNPEELGVVNVELTSDASGKMSAVLSVEKQETLNLLQQDLHQLKSILKEIGIDDSSVSLQLSSNAGQGQQQQSEYVAWDERERMLTRNQEPAVKSVAEKAMYTERSTKRRLDIQA